jgi:caffeoyl-CoA O-methyltransferase
VAEAIETLSHTPGPFDLIFNDIDKECYPESLPMISSKLRPGGVLIVDNLLWGGRVFDEYENDPGTAGVREFTRLLTSDPDWISSIIPIRDGMLVAFRS